MDILVNDAAVIYWEFLEQDQVDERWRRILDVNLVGMLNCVKAVIEPMKT